MDRLAESLALAVLQGLTEFLPVSSSGHLQALKRLTGSELAGDISLDVILHFATLLAVVVVYRREWARVVSGLWRGGEPRRDLMLVAVGVVPAGIVGLLLADRIELLPTRAPYLLPVCWGAMGLALLGSRGRGDGERTIGPRAALWIGAWQALALLPGVSRSGITILAALWIGVRREDAARYSFLIAAPLIAGATVLELPEIFSGEGVGAAPGVLAIAFVVAFGVGYGALLLLLRMLRGGNLHWWGIYLLVIAAAFAAWVGGGPGR